MKTPLTVLFRVKKLKEEEALKEANAKRAAAVRAAEETEQARAKTRESAATLIARQDAVYREIIGKTVKLDEIETTKGRAVKIEKDHGKLVDAEDRCVHVQAEAETERDGAIGKHKKSLKDVDKYVILTDRERTEFEELCEQREEIEIEDLYGTNRRALL